MFRVIRVIRGYVIRGSVIRVIRGYVIRGPVIRVIRVIRGPVIRGQVMVFSTSEVMRTINFGSMAKFSWI